MAPLSAPRAVVTLAIAALLVVAGSAQRVRAPPEPEAPARDARAPVRFKLSVYDDAGAELPDPAPLFETEAELHADAAVHDAFDALDSLKFAGALKWAAARVGGRDLVSSINGLAHALPKTAWVVFHTTAGGRADGRRETRANVSPGAVLVLDGDELAFRHMPVGRAPPGNSVWGGGPEGGMARASPTPTPASTEL